ncbi:hypothetical protein ACTMTI_54250 [Nonomuraea sp. H19]|uniref:hypothetical protein n=1 Tax=Nonomuraea sp. H19 TaxID=3452206 RepID=UPI003F8B5B3D
MSYTVVAADGPPIEPVEAFLAWMAATGASPNTMQGCAYDLRDFFVRLDQVGLSEDDAIAEASILPCRSPAGRETSEDADGDAICPGRDWRSSARTTLRPATAAKKARRTTKTEWVGYRDHQSETCDEDRFPSSSSSLIK